MAAILKELFHGYFWVFNDLKDPRTDDFLLVSSPFKVAFICLGYLYLIYKIVPEFMQNRPPYKLDSILIPFNLMQIIANAYIFFNTFFEVQKIDWYCAPIDFSDTSDGRFVLKLGYCYLSLKILDLLDTIFFILREKANQVSFLHVYHHFGMIVIGWIGVRFLGGGHSIFVVFVNSFVHTVMYFYYLLTVWKPAYKRSIWWKKYITQLQLIQFVFLFCIYGQLLFKPQCTYPKLVSYVLVPQSIFMILLFGDFYWNVYIKPQKMKKEH